MHWSWLIIGLGGALTPVEDVTQLYTIAGIFDGCSPGKLYGLEGGGVLECEDYKIFVAARPTVLASGREVILIGEGSVRARLHSGSMVETRLSEDFEGCSRGRTYQLDNGLVFQCEATSYSRSFRPEVKIFVVEGRAPVVLIDGERQDGSLFR